MPKPNAIRDTMLALFNMLSSEYIRNGKVKAEAEKQAGTDIVRWITERAEITIIDEMKLAEVQKAVDEGTDTEYQEVFNSIMELLTI